MGAHNDLKSVLPAEPGRYEPVANLNWHWCYDWRTFSAVYDHQARQYLWYADAGCSCNSYGDYFTASDCSFGSRDDLLRAARDWFDRESEYDDDPMDRTQLSKIQTFRPSKNYTESEA